MTLIYATNTRVQRDFTRSIHVDTRNALASRNASYIEQNFKSFYLHNI